MLAFFFSCSVHLTNSRSTPVSTSRPRRTKLAKLTVAPTPASRTVPKPAPETKLVAALHKFNVHHDVYTVGEDCAGIGTFSLAVENAASAHGHTVDRLFVSESDVVLLDWVTSRHQYKASCTDVTKRKVTPKVRAFGAGCPCQPESSMGAQNRGADTRSGALATTVQWLGTTCEKKQSSLPNGFVLEQVKGFVRGETARRRFNGLLAIMRRNYVVKWAQLNSQHFVPQSRGRVYIVGVRKILSTANKFSFPTTFPTVPPLDTILESLPWCNPPTSIVAQRNVKIGETMMLRPTTPVGTFGVCSLIASPQRPACTLRMSPCITCTNAKELWLMKKASTTVVKWRALDVVEIGKLQGFDNTTITGLVSKVGIVKAKVAFGNSFTLPVMQAVVEQLLPCI